MSSSKKSRRHTLLNKKQFCREKEVSLKTTFRSQQTPKISQNVFANSMKSEKKIEKHHQNKHIKDRPCGLVCLQHLK